VNGPWNSLEIAKLVASLITAVVVLILGIAINNSIKSGERAIALRSDIYKTIGGDLNDIYAYLEFVGRWKEMTPSDVIAKKRAVDKAMYTYRPFFSDELFHTYETFMDEAFRSYGKAGKDARIRSDISTPDGDRKIHGREWQADWEDSFTKERNKKAQKDAYNRFLEQLARDLALK
jgi:hypothetical protein